MKREYIERLRCPQSGQSLQYFALTERGGSDGFFASVDSQFRYIIRNGIPRFVPESNYADNFGLQWNRFAKTQLDSHSGHSISAERFWKATGWDKASISGKWVLDVGCGSGRFAEIALSTGANVVALDYSSAVDACWENLKSHPNLYVVQGDIYALPFSPQSFDFIYSLGVLQHTPDVAKAFASLPPLLRDGGKICVDFYDQSGFRLILHPKFWLRPITKRTNKKILFKILEMSVPFLLTLSSIIGKIPFLGKYLKYLIPVANYENTLPLNKSQLQEWALLDTFDWFSPMYDNPQNAKTIKFWLEKASLKNIEILKIGHLVGRGIKNIE